MNSAIKRILIFALAFTLSMGFIGCQREPVQSEVPDVSAFTSGVETSSAWGVTTDDSFTNSSGGETAQTDSSASGGHTNNDADKTAAKTTGGKVTSTTFPTNIPENTSNIFYVSPDGDDRFTGTKEYPFKTLERARQAVAKINKNMKEDIVVYLRGGNHYLTEPLELGTADSGTNGKTVRYEAYPGETPVIHGGTLVTGWEQHDANIYKATLNWSDKLRQLYVNGKRAVMAKGVTFTVDNSVRGYGSYVVDKDAEWAINGGTEYEGYTFSQEYLGKYKNPGDVEMVSKTGFGYHVIGLKEITSSGTRRVAVLQQPIGAIAMSIPEWGSQFIGTDASLNAVSEITFQNAYELLNMPGEFYFDRSTKTLYYCKQDGEDMSKAQVIAPISEGLIRISGDSTGKRACNITFKGITFSYDHWPLMKVGDSYGDTTAQSVAMYTKYVNDGNYHLVKYGNTTVQGAAVEVENASGINIADCIFRHIGAMGVSFANDTVNSSIVGCVFNDIGSAAINVGDGRNVLIDDGDFAAGKEGPPKNINIKNNYIDTVAVESKQAPAVSIFFTENLDFSHNEIYNAPYTGISLGWGWVNFVGESHVAKNNKVNNNIIAKVMQTMHDGAAIYTLGEQPGGEICGNYIHDIVSPANCIYLDQGSAYFKVNDNVCSAKATWLYVWGTDAQVKQITASGNYSSNVQGFEGNHLLNSPNFTNASGEYSSAVKKNQDSAGLESHYDGLRNK